MATRDRSRATRGPGRFRGGSSSSKCSTPRLSRVTPISRSVRDLGFRKRAGLAFERDFLGRVPRDVRPQAIDKPLELP